MVHYHIWSVIFVLLNAFVQHITSNNGLPPENVGNSAYSTFTPIIYKSCAAAYYPQGWFCHESVVGEELEIGYDVTSRPNYGYTTYIRSWYIESPPFNEKGKGQIIKSNGGRCTKCSISKQYRMEVNGMSYMYRYKIINYNNKFDYTYLKTELKYERKNLTWLVTDERFWYHIRGDNLHVGANAEATSYPSPDRYTLTTDNNTILMDHNNTYKHLSYSVGKTDLAGVEILVLTVYTPGSVPLQRTLQVSDIFPRNVTSDETIVVEAPELTEKTWKVTSCTLITLWTVIILIHILLCSRALRKLCCLQHSYIEKQPAINVHVNNYNYTPAAPDILRSFGSMSLSDHNIQQGEHAPSTRSNSIHEPETGELQSLDMESVKLRLLDDITSS